jgi:hypothetical protein
MKQYSYLGTLGIGSSTIVYVPTLQISILGTHSQISQMAMVDSGSSISIMNFEIAEFLKIDKEKCKKVNLAGITGKSVGYESTVTIVVDGFTEKITLPVIFTKELNTGILLGQIGFFDKFTVIFEKKHNIFTLDRNKTN